MPPLFVWFSVPKFSKLSATLGGRMDGQQQRKALSAAERSIHQLAGGKPEGAERAAALAAELDQIGVFSALTSAVSQAATDLRGAGVISEAAKAALVDAVGPGPLAAAVSQL